MAGKHELPHLINLLDDETPAVRQAVARQLLSFGPEFRQELSKLPADLVLSRKHALQKILASHMRGWLKAQWPAWKKPAVDIQRLEKGMSMLAEFQSGLEYWNNQNISEYLDRLAGEYRKLFETADEIQLAKFLFAVKEFKGAADDYYNPQNSNLLYTLHSKKGLPITLVCLYILVGDRLGLRIEGCNLPGHFMARVRRDNMVFLVDCFNGGRVLGEDDWERMGLDRKFIFAGAAQARDILKRVLANLIRAYQLEGNKRTSLLLTGLFKQMEESEHRLFSQRSKVVRELLFHSGQVVRHKRYGYRGIIVDYDPTCQASDQWYFMNQTQPDRDQPWYHVLVHGSDQVTYVAQSSLSPDESPESISHPLVEYFFKESGGHYVRNDTPWPRETAGGEGEP